MTEDRSAAELVGLPPTRAAARACGSKKYFTGRECRAGHTAARWTTNKQCCECHKKTTAAWQSANKDKLRASQRKHFLNNRSKCNAACTARQKKNMSRNAAYTRLYNAKKRSAQPPWLTPDEIAQIRAVYDEARAAGMTVDHIVPLNGKNVCGLHVPWNLRVVSRAENTAKGNRLLLDLLEAA